MLIIGEQQFINGAQLCFIFIFKCANLYVLHEKGSKFQIIPKYVHYHNIIVYIIYIVPYLHVIKVC
jgi:hypothetical protein